MLRIRIAAVSLLLSALSRSSVAALPAKDGDGKHYHDRIHRAARVGINGNLRHSNGHGVSSEIGNECYVWSSSMSCTSRRNYCSTAEGQCMEGAGTCRAKPEVCTMQYDPVCGCDGRTHSNACQAGEVGVNVWHRGSCEEGNSCNRGDRPCENAENYFCKMSEGLCGEPLATQRGTCAHYSESGIACDASWEPVCGCDGRVYSNSCVANYQNGVNVSYRMDGEDDSVLPGDSCEIEEQTSDERRENRRSSR